MEGPAHGGCLTTTGEVAELGHPRKQHQVPPRGQGLLPETRCSGMPKGAGEGSADCGEDSSNGHGRHEDGNADVGSKDNEISAADGNEEDSRGEAGVAVVARVAEFTHPGQYVFFALVSRSWRDGWKRTGRPRVTTYIALADCSGSSNANVPAADATSPATPAVPTLTVEQLQYSFAIGLPRDRAGVCAALARTGNLELLKRAREEGCPWDHRTSAAAAEGGHLHVLKWARGDGDQQQQLPQRRRHRKGEKSDDAGPGRLPCPWHANTAMAAATGGHLEVLKWLRENGCGWDEYTCHQAASGGHLEVLRWARANGCEWNAATCSRAARGGHLLLLKWARENGCPWDASTCMAAAEGGHLEVLRWARGEGECPWDERVCRAAAQGGHLQVLKWARANGCNWDEQTCSGAARWGHLGILRWARSQGCPWDKETCSAAAEGGRLGVLKWARANACPWDENTIRGATMTRRRRVVQWCKENGCPI